MSRTALPQRKKMWATNVSHVGSSNFVSSHTKKCKRKQVELILIISFITQYIPNIIISRHIQYFKFNKIFYSFFYTKSSKFSVSMCSSTQAGHVTRTQQPCVAGGWRLYWTVQGEEFL